MRRVHFVSAAAIAILLCAHAAGQQAVVPGRAAISGVVVESDGGRPVPGAVVSLGSSTRMPAGLPASLLTDEQGRFVFTGLAASDAYTVNVWKAGFLSGHAGRHAGGRNIVVAEGEWVRDVKVELDRPSAIAGTVLDEHGVPVAGMYVRVLNQLLIAGRPQMSAGAAVLTDDRGAYRISNLSPGRYVVMVPNVQIALPATLDNLGVIGRSRERAEALQAEGRPQSQSPPLADFDPAASLLLGRYPQPTPRADAGRLAYRPVFFPGASSYGLATPIALRAGEERSGIDFQLQPVPVARVAGRVEGPPDAQRPLTLRLVPEDMEDLGLGSEVAAAQVGDGGQFVFLNVPAGSYIVLARRVVAEYLNDNFVASFRTFLPSAPGIGGSSTFGGLTNGPADGKLIVSRGPGAAEYWGRQRVTVDGDVNDLIVTMHRGATLAGTVEGKLSTGSIPSVMIEPANGRASGIAGSPVRLSDNPTFEIKGLLPGLYFVRPAFGGVFKSVTWQGRDYTDVPLEITDNDLAGVVITLTDQAATIAGTVHDEKGAPASDVTVMAFPVDRRLWANNGLTPPRFASASTSPTGEYRLQNLPAAEYFVIASDAETYAWRDAAFLERAAPLAVRTTVEWAGKATQDLTVRVIR